MPSGTGGIVLPPTVVQQAPFFFAAVDATAAVPAAVAGTAFSGRPLLTLLCLAKAVLTYRTEEVYKFRIDAKRHPVARMPVDSA